jgi:hypothetical protein
MGRGGFARGGGRRPRRGSGRSAVDRAHARPQGASSPAAESARRTAARLEALLAAKGITVADVALALGVRSIDVARWRRGQPIPAYRRAELEARIERLEVVDDPATGERFLRLRPGGRA